MQNYSWPISYEKISAFSLLLATFPIGGINPFWIRRSSPYDFRPNRNGSSNPIRWMAKRSPSIKLWAFIAYLATPEHLRNPPAILTEITDEEDSMAIRRWSKQTTMSLWGRHLGFYKAIPALPHVSPDMYQMLKNKKRSIPCEVEQSRQCHGRKRPQSSKLKSTPSNSPCLKPTTICNTRSMTITMLQQENWYKWWWPNC